MLRHFGFQKSNCNLSQRAYARSNELFFYSCQHLAILKSFRKLMARCCEPQWNHRPFHSAIGPPIHSQATVTVIGDESLIAQEKQMKLELRIVVG